MLLLHWEKKFKFLFLLSPSLFSVADCWRWMVRGSNLVKVRPNGRTYNRFFSLEEDLSCIRWVPTSKKASKATGTYFTLKFFLFKYYIPTITLRKEKGIWKIQKNIKENIGSGYPADPITKEFLKKNWNQYPEIFRHSWSTYRELSGEDFINRGKCKHQKTLGDF